MKAIIPAAGRGTRFLPVTKAIPKEMLPVLNKPVIQYVVEEAAGAHVSEVVIVSNHEKRAIEEHFAPNQGLENYLESFGKTHYLNAVSHTSELARISFVYQDEPKGLGDAVLCGMGNTGDESFFVLLGDTIIPNSDVLKKMVGVSESHNGANVIAVVPVPKEDVSRFGVIKGSQVEEGVLKVEALVEKPRVDEAPSNLAIFGRYLLTSTLRGILEQTQPGVGGEVQLTDALQALLESEDMYALVIDPEVGFDTGTVDAWLETNVAFHGKMA